MAKFQEGDIVEVIANESEHGFEIGEKIRITVAEHMGYQKAYLAEGVVTRVVWAVSEDEIQAQTLTNG